MDTVAGDDERLLKHHRELSTKCTESQRADVIPIECYLTLEWWSEALEELE